MIKRVQLMLNSLFKKIKFFEISNSNGQTLLFDGDIIKVGDSVNMRDEAGNVQPAPDGDYELVGSSFAVKISVADGRITKITNLEDGSELTEFTPQSTPQEAPQQEPQQVAQSETPSFYNYLKTQYLASDGSEFPFDECVKQMEQEGYDCPECVCAAIKNRTVQHIVNEYNKSVEEAVKMIAEDLANTKYISKGKNKQAEITPIDNNQVMAILNEFKQMMEDVNKEIEMIKQSIIKQSSVSIKKPIVSKEADLSIDEYREKYFNIKPKTKKQTN